MRIYYRGNNTVIEVSELKDQDGNVIESATVEATLTIEGGSVVPNAADPIILTPSGAGRYAGTLPPVDLPVGSHIIVEVAATESGITAISREKMVVKDRTFNKIPLSC